MGEGNGPCRIELANSELTALVELQDVARVEPYRWYLVKHGSRVVVQATAPKRMERTRGVGTVQMHRVVMNPPKGYRVRHEDSDGLNNCRSNLEVLHQERWKGYCWVPDEGTWRWTFGSESGLASNEMDAAFYRDWAIVDGLGSVKARGRTNFSEHALEAMIRGAKARGEKR